MSGNLKILNNWVVLPQMRSNHIKTDDQKIVKSLNFRRKLLGQYGVSALSSVKSGLNVFPARSGVPVGGSL